MSQFLSQLLEAFLAAEKKATFLQRHPAYVAVLRKTYVLGCIDQLYRKDFDCCTSIPTARQTVCCLALFSFNCIECMQYKLNNTVVF